MAHADPQLALRPSSSLLALDPCLDNRSSRPLSYSFMASYYRILGVSRFASLDEIRHAYWALSRRIRDAHRDHDKSGSFAGNEIDRAYETLSDADRRREYDAHAVVAPRRIGEFRLASHGAFDSDATHGFPAIAEIVDRMRQSFFGSHSTTSGSVHTTRIELTVRQAHEGTRVPVDLTIQPSCPVCGGRGELTPGSCGVCSGTGVGQMSHHVQLPVPPGVRDGARLIYSVTPPFAAEAQIELRIAVQ